MKPYYSKEEIHSMAENALNAAVLSVQNELGQTDGGIAGWVWSGKAEEIMLDILKSYIRTEITFLGAEK